MKISLSTNPEKLMDRKDNHVNLIVHAESSREDPMWLEAEVRLEGHLSLKEIGHAPTGRFRLGICYGRDILSKGIKVYANNRTMPGLYRCLVTIYPYDHNGEQKGRYDVNTLINCGSTSPRTQG